MAFTHNQLVRNTLGTIEADDTIVSFGNCLPPPFSAPDTTVTTRRSDYEEGYIVQTDRRGIATSTSPVLSVVQLKSGEGPFSATGPTIK